jgi:hypothetical protein
LSTIGFTQNNPVWELIDVNRRATQDAHLLIHPNLPVYIRAQYQDADIIWGDSVLIEWHKLQLNPLDGLCCLDTLIGTGDTLQATFAPAPPYRLRVVLQDLTGLSTEDTVTLIFPYLDTTGSDLTEHIAKLTDSLDFLLGGGKTKDTVFF